MTTAYGHPDACTAHADEIADYDDDRVRCVSCSEVFANLYELDKHACPNDDDETDMSTRSGEQE